MRITLVVGVLLVAMSACNDSGEPTPQESESLATTAERSELPSTSEPSDAPAPDVDEPIERSSTRMANVVEIVDISYGCGPNDGLWAEAVVVASEPDSVFAQFTFEGTVYGRSDVVALTPGEQAVIGFYPEQPNEAFQRTGTVEILVAGATTPSAESDALLELPDGVSCG